MIFSLRKENQITVLRRVSKHVVTGISHESGLPKKFLQRKFLAIDLIKCVKRNQIRYIANKNKIIKFEKSNLELES